jgi:Rrf2 family protein
MLSHKTRYALKALMMLADAEKAGKTPVLITDLARKGEFPKKFLEAILVELKNAGVLQSKKGKGGGYSLGKSAEEIKIGQVVRVMEGPLALLPSVSKMAYSKSEDCRDEATCGIRALFQEVRDATARILDNASVADIQRHEERARSNRAPVYSI